jgi:ribosomal-protein-serine acetyltransferase
MGLMFTTIVGPGVELRLLEERHAAPLFALVDRERPYLRQWLSWVDARSSEEEILAFIHATLETFASGNGFSAGIWADGAIAGVITLHKIDWRDRVGEIGYWLGREFQGRGIMTEAARAVTEHALVELDLHRVEIRCAAGNGKSSAIPKRLGFSFDGLLRQASLLNGDYLDLEVYSMLRSEYRR